MQIWAGIPLFWAVAPLRYLETWGVGGCGFLDGRGLTYVFLEGLGGPFLYALSPLMGLWGCWSFRR